MLGIDVSKNTLSCALMDTNRQILWEQIVPNTEAGIAILLDKVADNNRWVVEPTGVGS